MKRVFGGLSVANLLLAGALSLTADDTKKATKGPAQPPCKPYPACQTPTPTKKTTTNVKPGAASDDPPPQKSTTQRQQ